MSGWLYENLHRDYPFLDRAAPDTSDPALPEEAIVELGVILGPASEFDPAEHTVWLARIARSGDTLLYELQTDAPGAASESLRFTRDVDDDELSLEWSESGPALAEWGGSASSSASSTGCEAPAWEGFLTTGRFAALLALLPGDGELTFAPGDWVVEPGRLQSLVSSQATAIHLANLRRTTATLPADCEAAPETPSTAVVNRLCLTGPLELKEGFNVALRQETQTNTIFINAAVGRGAGEPCEEFPLYDGEEKPAGSLFYSGGPACSEIVASVNGVSARYLRIAGGPGIRVGADPDAEHTLLVEADLHGLAICPPTDYTEPEESSSASGEPE